MFSMRVPILNSESNQKHKIAVYNRHSFSKSLFWILETITVSSSSFLLMINVEICKSAAATTSSPSHGCHMDPVRSLGYQKKKPPLLTYLWQRSQLVRPLMTQTCSRVCRRELLSCCTRTSPHGEMTLMLSASGVSFTGATAGWCDGPFCVSLNTDLY